MKVISDREFYKAKFEYEEFMEKALENGGTPESPALTSAEQSLLKRAAETIAVYEAQEEVEELVELDEVFWHEAGDRTEMVMSILQILLEHPAIAQTERLREKVESAQSILYEVYTEAFANAIDFMEKDSGEAKVEAGVESKEELIEAPEAV